MQKQSLEIGIFNQKRFILLKGGLPHVQKNLSNKHENVSFSFFLLPSSTSEKNSNRYHTLFPYRKSKKPRMA